MDHTVINGFTLVNEEKLGRAINGSIGKGAVLYGGVGDKAEPEEILAEYDRLGGLILQGLRKVKTGSFYDFEKGEARKTPEVLLIMKDLDGNVEEVNADEITPEMLAAEKIAEKKKAKQAKHVEEEDSKKEKAATAKKAKAGKGKKAASADEDEE